MLAQIEAEIKGENERDKLTISAIATMSKSVKSRTAGQLCTKTSYWRMLDAFTNRNGPECTGTDRNGPP